MPSFSFKIIGLGLVSLLLLSTPAHARILNQQPYGPLPTRVQNPLYLQFLATPLEAPKTLNRNQFETTLATTFSNLFEYDPTGTTTTNLDMEIWRTALQFSYGVTEELDVKIEVPFISNGGGFLDGFVQWYHGVFGFPNGGRNLVADNQFSYQVSQGGVSLINYGPTGFGLSDITVRTKYLLSDKIKLPFKLAILPYVKLPTGNENKGLGSGHVDAGLSLIGQKSIKRFHFTTQAGFVLLGPVTNLTAITRDYFFTFGQSIEFQIVDGFSTLVQLTGNTTAFKNVDTVTLSDPVITLDVGFAGSFLVKKGSVFLDEFFYQATFSEDVTSRGPAVDFSTLFLVGVRY